MTVLLDTNLLFALAFPRDINHEAARLAMRGITSKRIIVEPVLPELFYLVTERMNYNAALRFFEFVQGRAFQIEALTAKDMVRMSEIMKTYEDNAFDFVDTAIMAVSERLNITDIYTFDHRDFSVFRPRHCDYLTLLP
jgi:uncharacterized protein